MIQQCAEQRTVPPHVSSSDEFRNSFRALFGNETANYAAALKHHYETGPPSGRESALSQSLQKTDGDMGALTVPFRQIATTTLCTPRTPFSVGRHHQPSNLIIARIFNCNNEGLRQ
ncbi:putative zinc-binding metallopeptidase [Magnetospirillum sp. SS-4]|uniref:putative zinc-binding metallopeptidase n=1 Tax=Magnetospirillum sp. SS-4 TaxID=2681465 RepID=UPI00157412EC